MNGLMCSAEPVELSLAKYEAMEQPDESPAQRDRVIEGIAGYIQFHIFKMAGRLGVRSLRSGTRSLR